MTDIRKHLPLMISCIRQQLVVDEGGMELSRRVREALRELLPGSYGVGAGCLVNADGQASQRVDVVVYDKTIPSSFIGDEEGRYDVRQALMVAMLEPAVDDGRLEELLGVIASVKGLRAGPQKQKQKQKQVAQLGTGRTMKGLFPLGVVGIGRLVGQSEEDRVALSLRLDTTLKGWDVRERPDYLLVQGQSLTYTNPELDGKPFVAATIHIGREPELQRPKLCYVCKEKFTRQHFFYTHLCMGCGDLNYQKRGMRVDLRERVALVMGARVKIGYVTALRLLRAGAEVIATTRFPHDAARRYSQEPDFAEWRERLHIYGIDLRYLPAVEDFCEHLQQTYPALDILVNNAAQTIRRPAAYYAHLLPFERIPVTMLPEAQRAVVKRSQMTLQLESGEGLESRVNPLAVSKREKVENEEGWFPLDVYDEHGQQVDLRPEHSWTQRIGEIDLTEMLEVQVVNVTVPFLLVSRLRGLLCRSRFTQRFIVNVSAAEGQFAQEKLGNHVHTNMAKAALNMLTHSAAADLAQDGIFMNSVDPGWVSHQMPMNETQTREEQRQLLPLDLDDAAARVCDPIFSLVAGGEASYGRFYKDYQVTAW